MKKSKSLIGVVTLALLGLVAAACAQSPAAEPGGQEPQSSSEEKTLYVGPVLVDCEGEGPQQCMLVREDPEQEYSLFYDQIEGFDYQEGYEYELVVKVEPISDAPAGGSSLKYSLVRIVSQTPVPIAGEGELKTIYVGPQLVDCVGVGPQKCMQVKENPQDDYSLYYDQIEGFEYEEGFEYQLQVIEEQVEDAPADASSLRWVLVSVDSKVPVADSETIQLEGPEWKLSLYLNAQGDLAEPLADTFTSANFSDGQVNGNAGCNGYFGGYEVDGNNLNIGNLASTEMFCGSPEGVMDQERDFLSAMSSVAAFNIEDEQLTLTAADGDVLLVFEISEPPAIPGSLWNVLMYNNGKEAVVSVIIGSEITAYFGEDGQLTGNAGCNNYSAAYEIDGDQISIGPAITTRMACPEPEGIMDQEMSYLAALEQASTYEIVEEQRLVLFDSGGSRLVDFIEARTFGLTETVWYLKSYTDSETAANPVLEGSEITARFDEDDLVSGSAGCNNYSDSYQVDGETINIELGPLTMMFCDQPQGVMDQETAYLAALDAASKYRILGTELVIYDANDQELLKYQASELVGVVWVWVEFLENNDTVTRPNMPANYSLEFLPDGQVALQADCNRANGTYTAKGSQLEIEILTTTLAACPEGSLGEEYIRLLNDAVAFIREGEQLFIDIKFDTGSMKFLPLE